MDRKKIIISIFLVLLISVFMLVQVSYKNKDNKKNIGESNKVYDEENNVYKLYDDSGNVVIESENEDALDIYNVVEDYDPQLPLEESGIDVRDYMY